LAQLNDLEYSGQIEKPMREKKLAGLLNRQPRTQPSFLYNAVRLLSI